MTKSIWCALVSAVVPILELHAGLAATIAALLGRDYTREVPEAAGPLSVVLTGAVPAAASGTPH